MDQKFNLLDKDNTLTTPASDIVKILILQARNNLFLAIEEYVLKKEIGAAQNYFKTVKSRLNTLWLELAPGIKRRKGKAKYDEMLKLKDSKDFLEIMQVVNFLNEELDEIKLIQIDNIRKYDKTSWETENRAHGL